VSALDPGQMGRVECLGQRNGSRYGTLSAFGIVSGAEVTLIQRQPACVVRIGETELALDLEIAAELLVRPIAPGLDASGRDAPRRRPHSAGLCLAILGLSAAIFPATDVAGQEPAPAAEAPACEENFFDSDGVNLRYLDCGTGDPVFLLHGFALTAEMNWFPTGLLASLPAEFRLLALDQRGHGRSDKPHEPARYGNAFAGDILNLMDDLGIEKAHVVGYSMGGWIALYLAAEHPERIRTVVVGGNGWRPPGDGLPEEVRPWLVALEKIAKEGGSITDAMWQPGWPEPPPQMRAGLDSNDATALVAVLRGMGTLDVPAESLQENDVPTLAVVGADDFLRLAAEALVEVKPNVELVVLPERNHATALFDPELERAVLDFLHAHR
jgi:pimeloyl-ACP methyl ester carboxylesterase/Fe2+ transport system protein FeoA